ncbi:hypothetical protein [Xenorhabdus hominickii]|uniref:Uncharacterized protein n=1 Tax=Xenorhabdus hominickii TaxID=351679 RepID=A0A2G0PYY8_XENHO|nr:hypothetical protein [Xenorhabdus hominickii]AOM42645.1 hypothetical protein A9255_20125 [Xenorhabdus hominickii]PHM52194.1 hypothetical protein Xhom_04573 [Xenorhabdus hominickii]PHM52714.1 hypothetical protein Xhom_04384 [Xenorhabdus hominickii]
MEYKYLLSLNTHQSLCVVRINGMTAMDNLDSPNGTQSSGINSTAFLENGSNSIELLFGSRSFEEDLKPESRCEVTLKKVSAYDKNDEVISRIKLMVDKDGNPVTEESLKNIPNKEAGFDFTGMSKIPAEEGLFSAKKNYSISGLPEWMWTKARPVTEKDLPMIKSFYQDIINLFAQKELDRIWNISKPAWEEWAIADNNNGKFFFHSMRFEDKIDSDKYTVRTMPEWKKFKLVSYNNGRLFRLEVGAHGRSPILFDNKITGNTATYSPYLSIINGKIVIAR